MRHQTLEQKDTWLEELGTNPLLCILGSCLGHQTFPLILLYWSVQAALRCLEVLAKARTLLGSPCSVKQPKIQENKTVLVWLQGPVAGQSQPCLPALLPLGTLFWSAWSLEASLLSSLCLCWSLELRHHQPPEHRGRRVDDVSRVSSLFFCQEEGLVNTTPLRKGQSCPALGSGWEGSVHQVLLRWVG